jgi:futalosine hydrolase
VEIALITATAMEMRAALAGVLPPGETPDLPPLAPPGGAFLPALRLEGLTLHPLLCGIGLPNAALALGKLLGKDLPLAGVLNLGLAGSYAPRLAPLGSLVAASEEIWPEYGLARGKTVRAKALGLALAERGGRAVFDRIALDPVLSLRNMGLNGQAAGRRGPAVTVAGVSGSPSLAGRLRRRTGGLMENMEGFALALGCLGQGDEGLPFAEIRSISNLAGLRPPAGWNLPLALDSLGKAARLLFSPAAPANPPARRMDRYA